jgi:hypothetical protein
MSREVSLEDKRNAYKILDGTFRGRIMVEILTGT